MMRSLIVRMTQVALATLALILGVDGAKDGADIIVVGGGTGGCALAARLCEGLPGKRIVLLERGEPRSNDLELKVRSIRLAYETWFDPNITESFTSEPNAGLGGRTVAVRAGKTLGGTSAINGGQWTEPRPEIPLSWGINGMTTARLRKLYRRAKRTLEVQTPPRRYWQTYAPTHIDAYVRAGAKYLRKPKGELVDSIWINELATDRQGRRRDSCTAYLDPVLKRGRGGRSAACATNLRLIQGVTVTRIMLDGATATGVEYVTAPGGAPTALRARDEVLLTAGPYGSPKLLQLSGIGPAALLAQRGVPLIADLPVGASAQARPTVGITSTYPGKPVAPENDEARYLSDAEEARFLAGKGGLLAIGTAATNGIAVPPVDSYVTSSNAVFPLYDALLGTPKVHLAICILNPDSRATVRIRSADPSDPPEVATNLLSEPADLARAVACLRRQREVLALWPGSFQLEELIPGDTGADEAALQEQAREAAGNAYHFVGACKIGSVVDGDLKVIGFDNLRVVDSSAIPDIPRYSGPASSVYMLAEHIAERVIARLS